MVLWKNASISETFIVILLLLVLVAEVQTSPAQPYEFFYITVNPDTVTVEAGANLTVSCRVEPFGGYNETVTLTAEDVPNTLTVKISPSSGTPSFKSTISVMVDQVAEGRYAFNVKGTGADGVTYTASVTIQVPYFNLLVDDKVLAALNGSQTSTGIHVESVYGYDKAVTLSVSEVSSNVLANLSTKRGTPSFTSTLTLTVKEEASFETSWITVDAVGSDGKRKAVTVELAVVYVNVTISKQQVFDHYGRLRGNSDGSYYPGDTFKIGYEVSTRNIEFSLVEFVYERAIFEGPETVRTRTGSAPFEVEKSAPTGSFPVKVKALATYNSVSGRSVKVEVKAEVPVEVVKYEPHFTILLTYLVIKGEGATSFEKPYAVIVRYEGNGPEHSLQQRAVIEDYTWEAAALKSLPTQELNVTSELGVVTFYATGLGYIADPYTPILLVDGTPYTYYDLPASFHWPSESRHSYAWTESLPCLSDPHATFTFQSCYGMNRTGTITTPLLGQTVAASYALTKPLERFAQKEDPILNWTDKPEAPLLFNNETRYAKIVMDVDDAVMGRVEASNFTQVELEATFYSSSFSAEPTKLFTANYTYLPEDFVQPLMIKAFKIEEGEWVVDNSVYVEAIFAPPTNLKVSDLYAAWFEAQGLDEEALKLVEQDLVEAEPQSFNGTGETVGKLYKYSFLYNLTVKAEGYGRTVKVSRLVVILLGRNETYTVYVNLLGGGVNLTLTHDAGQYAVLKMFAPPEAGGIARITVYDEAGEPLTSMDVSAAANPIKGVLGFSGEHEIFLTKTPNIGTILTVEVENVWGATTSVKVQVQPYRSQARWTSLDELALWLFILIAAVVAFNLAFFLVKGKKV
ncbi:MAG: hypothetical protein QXF26_10570 [Candidatus Bathyarchaeia archaeon]